MGLSLAELDLAAAFTFGMVPEDCFDEAACEPITFPVGMMGIPGFGRVLNCQDLLRGGGVLAPVVPCVAEGLCARTKYGLRSCSSVKEKSSTCSPLLPSPLPLGSSSS